MKFKKGDRVLVEGEVNKIGHCGSVYVGITPPIGEEFQQVLPVAHDTIQLDPGVTIAALLRELEIVDGQIYRDPSAWRDRKEYATLRSNREAANKPAPKFTEGQKVTRLSDGAVMVVGEVKDDGRVRCYPFPAFLYNPDDIRAVEK